MHDAEWARYMLEILYLLWFQVFSSTLPIYITHTPRMIDFAKKLSAQPGPSQLCLWPQPNTHGLGRRLRLGF